MTERDFQSAIIDLAHLRGYRIHHCRPAVTPSGKWATHISGDPGFCDLVLAKPGRILFLEVKSDRGRVTPDQVAWLAALDTVSGVTARVVRPEHWDWVVEALT